MLASSPLGRKANRFDWLQRVVLGVGRSSGCGCGGAAAAVGSDVPPIFCIPARDQMCLAPRGSLEIYVHSWSRPGFWHRNTHPKGMCVAWASNRQCVGPAQSIFSATHCQHLRFYLCTIPPVRFRGRPLQLAQVLLNFFEHRHILAHEGRELFVIVLDLMQQALGLGCLADAHTLPAQKKAASSA